MEEKVVTGRAIGGKASRDSLTPEQRKEAARHAAKAKAELAKLPKATHIGSLTIGEIEIPCYVLDNGQRVLSSSGISNALVGGRSGASIKLRRMALEAGGAPMPVFLAPSQLKPFIDKHLGSEPLQPLAYIVNGKKIEGFDASILPAACEIWLEARDAGALQDQQLPRAKKAEILMRGLARVGIIALVDEATGYQRDRAKDALSKILEAYIAKELQPWVKTFDADFYEEMFRLRGLPYPPEQPNFKPQYFGKLTNDIVYRRLMPGVLEALKEEAAKAEKKGKLHQHLTAGYGRQHLLRHLGKVIALMNISDEWDSFIVKLDKVAPRFGDTLTMDV